LLGISFKLCVKYWVVDDKKIYDGLKSDFRNITRFIEGVVKYVG